MATFLRPDVFIEERSQLEGPILPAATGFGILEGVTEKGPAGTATRTRNFPDWKRVYGDRQAVDVSDMTYEAKAFFDEGGVELITSRLVHYADIDDPDSFTGGTASAASLTASLGATAASVLSSIPGPFNLDPGGTLTIDVDNGGPAVATFDATQAVTAGSGLSIVDLTGLTLLLKINNQVTVQTITFSGSEATVADVAVTINNQMVDGSAQVNGAEVDIFSDRFGTLSKVRVDGGTALTEIGHVVGDSFGTGDVGDINAVTGAEVKTVVEADISGITLTVNPDQTVVYTSDSTGVASELDITNSATVAALGLTFGVTNGTAAGSTELTLTLESGFRGTLSPGVRGNLLKKKITQNPLHPSTGAGSDLAADAAALDLEIQVVSLNGINPLSVLKLDDGGSIIEFVIVANIRVDVILGVATFFVELATALVNPFTAAASTVESREFDLEIFDGQNSVEFFTALSMLDTADNYVETILNDENTGSEFVVATDEDAVAGIGADLPATDAANVDFTGGTDETIGLVDADVIGSATGGTGFHAFDNVREFTPLATPNQNSAAVVHAAAQYCKSRLFFFYVTYTDIGLSASAAVSYRQNTLGLDSSYVGLYAGGMRLFDPAGSGSSPRRDIAGVGGIMGLYGRVDSLPPPLGGPWESPAGEGDFGTLTSALDVATIYNDSDADLLNPAGVNAIRKFGRTSPVLVFGARTLDSSTASKFLYINVRRFFQFVELSVADSTRFAIFRNNDFRLWSRLTDSVDAFLTGLLNDRAFPTSQKELAFFVSVGIPAGTMTQADVDAGRVIGEIGLAPQKPGEFIIWRFTQFESGSSVEEA